MLASWDGSGQSSLCPGSTANLATALILARAQVDVQNAVARVEPLLPQSVVDQGVLVEEAGSGFLMMVALTSDDGSLNDIALGDYINRNVAGEIRRIEGVGRAQVFAPNGRCASGSTRPSW